MSRPSTPQSRRRTVDFVKPEQSLAEWSSKIRELQAQVDMDDALEQQRIEEEIARSRLERAKRRSTGSALATASYRMNLNRIPDDLQGIADKQNNQSEAFRKLTGGEDLSLTPSSPGTVRTPSPLARAAANAEPQPQVEEDKPQPETTAPVISESNVVSPIPSKQAMSLAEFMGGKATGPRLNKHAAQPDATDPTLFIPQRSMKDLPTGPAKPGGTTNGFALPGLASSTAPSKPLTSQSQSDSTTAGSSPSPNTSPPPAIVNNARSSGVSSTVSPLDASLSTPPPISSSPTIPFSASNTHNLAQPKPSKPVTARWPPAAAAASAASPPPSTSGRGVSTPTPKSPPIPPTSPPLPSGLGLARPIQPNPAMSQTFLPNVSKPSPAFQKPEGTKEERPSITRLQGRGFVEKRVRDSQRLVALTQDSHATGRRLSVEKPPEKKISVLDRWPAGEKEDPAKAAEKNSRPPTSPKPQWPPARSATATPSSPAQVVAPWVKSSRPPSDLSNKIGSNSPVPSPSPKPPVVSATTRERTEYDATPVRLPGLGGNETTRQVPTKSRTEPAIQEQKRDVNVLGSTPMRLPGLASAPTLPTSGLKRATSSNELNGTLEKRRSVHFDDSVEILPAAERSSPDEEEANHDDWQRPQADTGGSQTLTHLTKGRAKKPRKAGAASRSTSTTQAKSPIPVQEIFTPKEDVQPSREEATRSPVPAEAVLESPPPLEDPIAADTSAIRIASTESITETPTYEDQIHVQDSPSAPAAVTSDQQVERVPEVSGSPPIPVSNLQHTLRPSEPVSASNDAPTPSSPPTRETPQDEDEKPRLNVKAAISAWAQKTSSIPPPSPSPSPVPRRGSYAEIERPSSIVQQTAPEEEEEEEPPKVDVRNAIKNWGQTPPSPVTTNAPQLPPKPPSMQIQIGRPAPAPPLPSPSPSITPVSSTPAAQSLPAAQPRPRPVSQNMERRRSKTYDRYSSIMMPPLKEEKTPAATPEGSLKIQKDSIPLSIQAIHQSLLNAGDAIEKHGDRPQNASEDTSTAVEDEETNDYEPHEQGDLLEVQAEQLDGEKDLPLPSPMDDLIELEHEDGPLGSFNLTALLASFPAPPKSGAGTISVETFVISEGASSLIQNEHHIFYDSEIVAVVHRGKFKASDLVTTTVWGWQGSEAKPSDKDENKLAELASRFGTKLLPVPQGKEPFDMVQVLGGTLAIRRGSRAHWSAENTAFHCIRTHGHHFIVIEEMELDAGNLCSAFSYCLAVLDAMYVWHGRGSIQHERDSALAYAKLLLKDRQTEPDILEEGSEDEMFWLMLGEGGYASADYWKFRPESHFVAPRLWHVQKNLVQVQPFCASDIKQDGVYLFDGVFELFVIVGEEARGQRKEIRLALAAAEATSAASAMTRIFPPPVHVLIFPTLIPIDLRANFRLMDETKLNGREPPEHINLLTLAEAKEHLTTNSWTRRTLRDHDFLPLGVDPAKTPL